MRRLLNLFPFLFYMTSAHVVSANETATYSYDALGRLVTTGIIGGPNNAKNIVACFDAAGNRSRYLTATGSVPSCSQGLSSLGINDSATALATAPSSPKCVSGKECALK